MSQKIRYSALDENGKQEGVVVESGGNILTVGAWTDIQGTGPITEAEEGGDLPYGEGGTRRIYVMSDIKTHPLSNGEYEVTFDLTLK